MKDAIVNMIVMKMEGVLNTEQTLTLYNTLNCVLDNCQITRICAVEDNSEALITSFIASKKVEGGSEKTLEYYNNTIRSAIDTIKKPVVEVTTDDVRLYLTNYQSERKVSNVTIDNIRRILSSFYGWLEEENHILKSPMKRIHKVKSTKVVKEVFTDEEVEKIREATENPRDLAIVDLLRSTGMRVGELVLLKRGDIDFIERECKVLGKGNKERIVYFDANTKLHLESYLESRVDDKPELFVHLRNPHSCLAIGGVESMLRSIGKKTGIKKVHPHRFRSTLATNAIDKGMPIEQVQSLLGHSLIDTTLHYAMVKQQNVKQSHRKYIG